MLYMFFLFILVVFFPSLTWKSAGNVAVHIASCYPVLYFVHVENKVCHFYKNTDCKCFGFFCTVVIFIDSVYHTILSLSLHFGSPMFF